MPNTPAPTQSRHTRLCHLNGPYHKLRRIALVNHWNLVRTALQLAIELHDGQTRKAGGPYIYHPIRATLRLWTLGIREEYILAAALLHDIIEDCSDRLTRKALARFYALDARTIAIVNLVTKSHPFNADQYYTRISTYWQASLIKLADRADNLATMNGAYTRQRARVYVEETKRHIIPLTMPALDIHSHYLPAFDALQWEIRYLTTKAELDFNIRNGRVTQAECHTQERKVLKGQSSGPRYLPLANPRTSTSSTPYGAPTAP